MANLYIFFSVLLPPAYSVMHPASTPNLQDIHHVLLVGKKSAHLTNQLTHGLHSLGASLGITLPSNHGILSCSYEKQPSPTSGSCDPFPNQQQCFPKVPSWRLSFSRQGQEAIVHCVGSNVIRFFQLEEAFDLGSFACIYRSVFHKHGNGLREG